MYITTAPQSATSPKFLHPANQNRPSKDAPHRIDGTAAKISTDSAVAAPLGFDPRQFPILAHHFYNCAAANEPPAEVINLSHIRLATALCSLGESIGIDTGGRAEMLKRLGPLAHEASR